MKIIQIAVAGTEQETVLYALTEDNQILMHVYKTGGYAWENITPKAD